MIGYAGVQSGWQENRPGWDPEPLSCDRLTMVLSWGPPMIRSLGWGAVMDRHTRRQLFQASLALAALSMLSGCEVPRLPWQPAKVPRIGVLAVGSREGRAFLIDGF